MTTEELKKLPEGTVVTWDDTGDLGKIVSRGSDCRIVWDDGQQTFSFDAWALKHVRVHAPTVA
jgi:hypothetical protein